MTPDLSIIIATCNRAVLLSRAIDAIISTVQCRFQLVLVDGASTDDTPAILQSARERVGGGADNCLIIREERREGFVRAANKGLRAATGRNIIWINDDAWPLPGALDLAVAQMDSASPSTGLLALFHKCNAQRSVAYTTTHMGETFKLLHVRGTLYANFGLARRQTWEKLNFFDERYFLNAADPDFSLKVWHAGLAVVPAWGALIDHDEHEDPRRAADSPRAKEDNEKFFAKWNLPQKNQDRNDFIPAQPCTLSGLSEASP